MTVRRLLICGCVLMAVLALTACGGSSHTSSKSTSKTAGGAIDTSKQLTVYASMQLQGEAAATDESIANAELLALEEAHGKADGRSVRLVIMDNSISATGSWDPPTVEQNANQAANDPTTIAYLGDDTSGAATLSIPILNRAGILTVSPTATATDLTLGGTGATSLASLYPSGTRTFARVIPSDQLQALAQAQYQQQENCTHVFVIDDGSVYGAGIAAGVAKADATAGMTVTGTAIVPSADSDFSSVVAKVTNEGDNCTFVGESINDHSVALWEAIAGIPGMKMFGADGLAQETFAEELPAAIQGQSFFTSPGLAPNAYGDIGQRFFETYEARFGGFPDPEAIFGYEAMSAVLASIDAVGKGQLTRAAIVHNFFSINDRASVLGTYSIDPNGDSTLDAYGAYMDEQGSLVFNHTLTPNT